MLKGTCSSAGRINGKTEFSPKGLKGRGWKENEEALSSFCLTTGETAAIFLLA